MSFSARFVGRAASRIERERREIRGCARTSFLAFAEYRVGSSVRTLLCARLRGESEKERENRKCASAIPSSSWNLWVSRESFSSVLSCAPPRREREREIERGGGEFARVRACVFRIRGILVRREGFRSRVGRAAS